MTSSTIAKIELSIEEEFVLFLKVSILFPKLNMHLNSPAFQVLPFMNPNVLTS